MDFRIKLSPPEKAKEFFEKKMAFTTGPVELKYFRDQKAEFNVIDVRAADDYAEGHIPGAASLPEDDWPKLTGLSKDRVNVIYCYSVVCHLAARAAVYFASHGFPVMELDGGFESWKEHFEGDIEQGDGKKAA